MCVRAFPPKNGEIALWPSTNGSIARLLVWVTILNVRQSRLYLHYWYRYVSLPKLSRELKNRSDQNIVPLNLIIGLIWFLRKTILGARQRGATRRSSRVPSGQVHIPGVYPPKKKIGGPIPGDYSIFPAYRGFTGIFDSFPGVSFGKPPVFGRKSDIPPVSQKI